MSFQNSYISEVLKNSGSSYSENGSDLSFIVNCGAGFGIGFGGFVINNIEV